MLNPALSTRINHNRVCRYYNGHHMIHNIWQSCIVKKGKCVCSHQPHRCKLAHWEYFNLLTILSSFEQNENAVIMMNMAAVCKHYPSKHIWH